MNTKRKLIINRQGTHGILLPHTKPTTTKKTTTSPRAYTLSLPPVKIPQAPLTQKLIECPEFSKKQKIFIPTSLAFASSVFFLRLVYFPIVQTSTSQKICDLSLSLAFFMIAYSFIHFAKTIFAHIPQKTEGILGYLNYKDEKNEDKIAVRFILPDYRTCIHLEDDISPLQLNIELPKNLHPTATKTLTLHNGMLPEDIEPIDFAS